MNAKSHENANRPGSLNIPNSAAASLPPLPDATLDAVRALYDSMIRGEVHHRW